MTDDPDPAPILEPAEALRAKGYTVEPTGDDFGRWLVDGEEVTDSDLWALAFRLGLMDGPGRAQ